MKYLSLIYVLPLLFSQSISSQNKELVKLWETEANLKVPESVLWDKQNSVLYFSNIDGRPNDKDGLGSIGKINQDGNDLTVEWITGLNAPKGMGIHKGTLYVADVDQVVLIDLKSAKIIKRITVEGAKFLNDITIGVDGAVYVSDMNVGKVHKIKGDKVETLLDKKEGVNGLYSFGDYLYFLVNGVLWRWTEGQELLKIAEGMDQSTDGIERTKEGDFIVSCWNGIIYLVKTDGNKTMLLDTREQKLNTADIGFDVEKNRVYVPTFFGNKIIAYQLK